LDDVEAAKPERLCALRQLRMSSADRSAVRVHASPPSVANGRGVLPHTHAAKATSSSSFSCVRVRAASLSSFLCAAPRIVYFTLCYAARSSGSLTTFSYLHIFSLVTEPRGVHPQSKGGVEKHREVSAGFSCGYCIFPRTGTLSLAVPHVTLGPYGGFEFDIFRPPGGPRR
jgi:hypothetical protein